MVELRRGKLFYLPKEVWSTGDRRVSNRLYSKGTSRAEIRTRNWWRISSILDEDNFLHPPLSMLSKSLILLQWQIKQMFDMPGIRNRRLWLQRSLELVLEWSIGIILPATYNLSPVRHAWLYVERIKSEWQIILTHSFEGKKHIL